MDKSNVRTSRNKLTYSRENKQKRGKGNILVKCNESNMSDKCKLEGVSYVILYILESVNIKVKLCSSFMLSLSLNMGTQTGKRHQFLQSIFLCIFKFLLCVISCILLLFHVIICDIHTIL